jgi:pimeloyl-ACP methyl ester carboxylesterase
MIDASRTLFVHGSNSSSQTYKAVLLKSRFPGMFTPDFTGDLAMRMKKLEAILGNATGWNLIGSSLGGLMIALFATRHPGQVRRLILLAPALTLSEFADSLPDPVPVPAVLIQGSRDEILPPQAVRSLAEKVFINLTYVLVDDDHRLHKTADGLDWSSLLE